MLLDEVVVDLCRGSYNYGVAGMEALAANIPRSRRLTRILLFGLCQGLFRMQPEFMLS